MHQDLGSRPGGARPVRALDVHRRRIAGTAILGMAIVFYWLGRLQGIW